MKTTCLYFHINPLKNEIFYVGIGTIKRPYSKHRSKAWHNIVSKYGYIIDVIETGLTWKDACEREISLIKRLGRRDLGLGNLVNHTDGGEGTLNCNNKSWSEERKKQHSNNLKKYYINNPKSPWSEKNKKILSDSHLGQIPWNKGLIKNKKIS